MGRYGDRGNRFLPENLSVKILHLIHRTWPYHGGAERYVWEHARAAGRWGHESTVFTTDAWDMSLFTSRTGRRLDSLAEVHDGVSIRRFRVLHPPMQNILRALLRRVMPGGRDRFFYPNPFVPSLYAALSGTSEFGFVHAGAMPFLIWAGYRYACRTGAGLATVPHGNLGEKYRRIEPIGYFEGEQPSILRRSSLVVAQSEFEKSVYIEIGVAPERILVLGSGVDPDDFRGADADRGRRKFALPPNTPVVVCLAAHCIDKGSVVLLRSCIEAWSSGADFTLVLAGPVLNDFRHELEENGLWRLIPEGKLLIAGYVREEDRADLLAAADLVAAPSRLDAFGIVLLDAWISGKPVIGCWSGAMPDLIDDGRTGFLVGFGDTATLTHRILTLLGDPGLRMRMGEEGRRTVLARYTWDRVTDRFYGRIAGCRTLEN
jgi:glycosyltransferase involved in cell wall biosynthesis